MANSELATLITDFLNSASDNISKKELIKEITKIYDDMKKPEEEKKEKKKREPTAYNIFMKEQMAKLKDEGSELSGKEKMSHIAGLWKAQKKSDGDDKQDKKKKKKKDSDE